MKPMITVKDKDDLRQLIEEEIKLNGNQCDLNYIDVSGINDMSWLFCESQFNGDISKWDVSNVEHMDYMFQGSKFNGDISKWNVSKVRDMSSIFDSSNFGQDVSDWKPYSLTHRDLAFFGCKATLPYWAYEDEPKKRKKLIDTYHLAKELSENLSDGGNVKKKLKI